tara:strand:- start:931 stop:2229 length:1299 start_codon:yes stop_codon:yes gene_type:complete
MTIKKFSDYIVESSKEVTFVFGRFNPPTEGHEKLFETLKKVSRGGTYRIYASKSQDSKKNPLPFKQKIKFMRKMFPRHARNIMADADVRTVLDIATKLYEQGFTKATMVAGSDRIKEFEILLNKYNGQKNRHGFYQFEERIRVITAGTRDPDAEGVTGMSASKLRAFVAAGDLQGFADNSLEVPGEGIQVLYYALRKGMGLKKESFRKHVELETVSEERERFVKGNIFNVGDEVRINTSGEIGTVITKGTNYLTVSLEEGNRKLWLEEVCEVGTDKTAKKYAKSTPGQSEGSNYFKGLSKSTSDKRKAHFKKNAKKDDNNPSAYTKAPGDARAKTKPSKHTKKYDQMFGELTFEDFNITEGSSDEALKKKADKTGMPLAILRKVFDRGYAAWRTGHRPGTNPTQWGLARVNSFVTKSKGTWGGADKDLAAKV